MLYAALKRRSSTVARVGEDKSSGLPVDAESRFLSGFAGSE